MAIGCLYPWTQLLPDTLLQPEGPGCQPDTAPGVPGGGGFGAVMGSGHFARYEVDGKWRGVKRVRVPTRSR